VTITIPGAYRLTGDLLVPVDGGVAILVQTGNVGLDLHGFAILGASCAATGGTCERTTGVTGVWAESSFGAQYRNISVRNGTIAGMSGAALSLGDHAVVSDLVVRHTGGIFLDEGSIARGCVVESTTGISFKAGSIVSENVVMQSAFNGIFVNAASVITRNTLYENSDDAIGSAVGSGGSVFLGNSIFRNGGSGTTGQSNNSLNYATVANNTVYQNGTNTEAFTRGGIQASWSLVHGNTIHGNGDAGLEGLLSGYRENVISDNAGGTVVGTGMVDLSGNLCNGTTTCP
jgi:hypothetical protein